MSSVFHSREALLAVADTATGGVGRILLGDAVATTLAASIPIPFKCEVVEAFLLILGTSAHATNLKVDFRNRPTAGTATGDSSIVILSKTASKNVQGTCFYKKPAARTVLSPGSQVGVVINQANGDACAYQAWVIVEEIPEQEADITTMAAG